jgi:hypothetical protein
MLCKQAEICSIPKCATIIFPDPLTVSDPAVNRFILVRIQVGEPWCHRLVRHAGAEPAGSANHPHHLPVAQLDEQRATNAKACRFDSCREGQFNLGKARVEEHRIWAAEARGRSTLPRPASLPLDTCEPPDRQREALHRKSAAKSIWTSDIARFV